MTDETILKYEEMAKLNLSDETRQWAIGVMNVLEESFKKLRQIDTGAVDPLISVLDLSNVFRNDVAKKFITRDQLLSNAPEASDGYFQVPKTLE